MSIKLFKAACQAGIGDIIQDEQVMLMMCKPLLECLACAKEVDLAAPAIPLLVVENREPIAEKAAIWFNVG